MKYKFFGYKDNIDLNKDVKLIINEIKIDK